MENASKALIIAGSILLAISIIGIGMFIFNKASESMSGVGLTKEQIATYNSAFDKYSGTQKGSAVRTLCNDILNHNLANQDDESKQIIIVENGSASDKTDITSRGTIQTTTAITDIKNKILSGKTYNVDFGYDKNSGLIIAVGIKVKTGSSTTNP